MSADTVVASYANPQSLNRFSYVTNNPLKYTDPTGHMQCEDFGGSCVSENQMTQIVRIHQRRTRHYSDNRQKDDVATAPMGSTGTGGPGSVNINLGPNGATIYNGPVFAGVIPVGDLQMSWSPSLTLNNGSQVIVSPSGITYGPPAAPVAPRFSMTGNGPSVGYVDSPIFNSPALSGLSIPFPQMGQVKMSTTQIVRTQSMSFVSRLDVTYTARPDYAAAAAAPVAVGTYALIQAQKALIGVPPCPDGLMC